MYNKNNQYERLTQKINQDSKVILEKVKEMFPEHTLLFANDLKLSLWTKRIGKTDADSEFLFVDGNLERISIKQFFLSPALYFYLIFLFAHKSDEKFAEVNRTSEFFVLSQRYMPVIEDFLPVKAMKKLGYKIIDAKLANELEKYYSVTMVRSVKKRMHFIDIIVDKSQILGISEMVLVEELVDIIVKNFASAEEFPEYKTDEEREKINILGETESLLWNTYQLFALNDLYKETTDDNIKTRLQEDYLWKAYRTSFYDFNLLDEYENKYLEENKLEDTLDNAMNYYQAFLQQASALAESQFEELQHQQQINEKGVN